MTRLPVCSGDEAIRVFERAGWRLARQRGSHVSLTKPGIPAVLTVPPQRTWLKRVIAEMGGKNAIIVDGTTHLEAAAAAATPRTSTLVRSRGSER